MIGGTDIVVKIADDLRSGEALDTVVRCVFGKWPTAVVQDASTGVCFFSFAEIAFGHLREIFVYRDKTAFDSWANLGADPANLNTMVHFIVARSELTIVVDDPNEATMESIVDEARCVLDPFGYSQRAAA
jgi:predicted RNA methylase